MARLLPPLSKQIDDLRPFLFLKAWAPPIKPTKTSIRIPLQQTIQSNVRFRFHNFWQG